MKYVNYKTKDENYFVGILDNDKIFRLKYNTVIDAINNEKNNDAEDYVAIDLLDDVELITPIKPSKIICVGLNYKDHAEELNMDLPKEPLLFMKPSTAIINHKDDIVYPEYTNKLDFEAELGIVILSKLNSSNNNDFDMAFTIVNDVTARDLQERDGQWTRSKSFDTFCPIYPIIVTNIDPSNQRIYSKVNGVIKQDSNTKNMIFSPNELVKYISNMITLLPGDIIATGTPPGIDHLNHGDKVTIGIENIGVLENQVK